MKKNQALSIITLVALLLPGQTYALSCGSVATPQDFGQLVCFFVDIISVLIPIVASIALLVFFWGLGKFILHAGDDSAREEGRQVMLWGIVALFVMVSVWGLVNFFISDFFGFSGPVIPQLPG